MINKNKVYALLIEAPEAIFLSSQYASSLEEALVMAKIEYGNINHLGNIEPLANSKISLFAIKTITKLMEDNKEFKKKVSLINNIEKNTSKETSIAVIEPIQTPTPVLKELSKEVKKLDKNLLMKEIIEKKDIVAFKENKKIFSKNEQKYIEERLLK